MWISHYDRFRNSNRRWVMAIGSPVKRPITNAQDANFYSDLNLSFVPHPLTGELTPLVNNDAIKRSLKTIVFLNQFDVPYDATAQTSVKNILFQPSSQLTSVQLRTNLEFIIKKLEPRITLQDIAVTADDVNMNYQIDITYSIKSIPGPQVVTFYLERVR